MRIQLNDDIPIEKVRLTRDGYLVADARAGRTGIQIYSGDEVGKPEMDTVRVYRPPEEVFDKRQTMQSFTSLPVTIDHPNEMVDAKNWKKHAVGYTGEDIARDGEFVRVPLIVKDAEAVERIRSGHRELSFGYFCDLEFTPGKTEDGEEYDAVQRGLQGNHLAIVRAGRAGHDCRIGDSHARDSNHGDRQMPGEQKTRMIDVDGIPVEATDASARVIETLQKRIGDANVKNLQMATDHGNEIKSKDTEIADLKKKLSDKETEVTNLKSKIPDEKTIDGLVVKRADVLTKARSVVADIDVTGKTVPEIRRAVVAKKLGDSAVKDRSDDYVESKFDDLVADAANGSDEYGYDDRDDRQHRDNRSDPIRDSMRGSGDRRTMDPDKAHDSMTRYYQDAWKGPQKGAVN